MTHCAGASQSAVDAAEQKAGFDCQMAKAQADNVEMKAAFDKVSQGITSSAQSNHHLVAMLDLTHMTLTCFMQSVADHAESKADFDARMDKASTDAAEMKAAFDKVGG
jgi:hypothetical protein